MLYIPPETVEKLREIDLLTYLQNYNPQELVRESGGNYCTATHDSLKISNGKWYWFSKGIGGANALDYLIKVEGYSFMSAAESLIGRVNIRPSVAINEPVQKKEFILPNECRSTNKIRQYLSSRGISAKVMNYCIQTERLYESLPYHNAVFVGFDRRNNAKYAFQRGCGTDFRGDVAGSDKRFSFALPTSLSSNSVCIFESAIDLLSYATLLERAGKDFRDFNLLSVEGVHRPSKNNKNSKLPLALQQYLQDNPDTEAINLYFDNDITGKLAAAMITTLLPQLQVKARFPPQEYKDANDFLTGKKMVPEKEIVGTAR